MKKRLFIIAASILAIVVIFGLTKFFGSESAEVTQDMQTLYDILPAEDKDQDGLTIVEEQTYGTDPELYDTDGDGLGDGEEIFEYGTDPTNPDTDDDGFPEGYELFQGYDPLTKASST
jgi:hypothetical protein